MGWKRTWEVLPGVVFVLSLMFLAYLAGSLTTLSDTFPSHYVRDAYRAAESLKLRNAYARNRYESNLWTLPQVPGSGVTVRVPGKTSPGLTLYTSGHAPAALLVDMDGNMVHEWKRPFRDVWDESSPIRKPVPEEQIYFRKAEALPNGDLLAIYIGTGDTPWGYGMVKLDKDSNVLWKNLGRFHHDFTMADDGRVFALTHEFRTRPLRGHEHLRGPLLEDFLTILAPDGSTLETISLLDAVQSSHYDRELFRVFHFTLWDPLHTNSVDVLDEQTAAALRTRVPEAAAGQVLLGFRELGGGTIALLDVERRAIVWALSGSWKSQHDPDILPDGSILLFDNLGDFTPGGVSRVIEMDPANGAILWSYGGREGKRLQSFWRAAQQRLPNGNTLITESQGARLIEIDRQGDIVWEFINPIRGDGDPPRTPVVSWASRLDVNTLVGSFRRKVLESGPVT